MVLSLIITVAGLLAVGLGLGRPSAWTAMLTIPGWALFMAGVVKLLVPGFF